ncbi:probable nicotinate-nucleotide adenylyltransferase [Ruminococcus sp. CAG:403]|nr:probable nicotinate-nucleotide adenylyltransferase [Ruminococcus sp. CAG:403]
MERIGLFGGSFHPIHNGHLHLAHTAMEQLHLQHVIFVPAYCSPFKQKSAYTVSDAHRLAMCRLAVAGEPAFSVSDYELNREQVSYTIDTISHFQKQNPEAAFVLLMGSDMLLQFDHWYRYQEILQRVTLGVVSRDAADTERIRQKQLELSQFGQIQIFCDAVLSVSSTKIREKLKKQEDCSCYLPRNVVQYIQLHHLYQMGQESTSCD